MLKRNIDTKYEFDVEESTFFASVCNRYCVYGLIPFLLLYGIQLIDWSTLSIALTLVVIVHAFNLMNVNRTKKALARWQ